MHTLYTHYKFSHMLKNLLIITLITFTTFACSTKTEEDKEAPKNDSLSLANPAQSELNSNQSTLLQNILGAATPESIIRGISFGDPVSKVKATETFEMFEEVGDHLGYTIETPQFETIDVQYFTNKDQKVNKITIDVYLNSADATKQLWEAGKKHFSETYEAPKEDGKMLIWNKKSVRVNMEDVSKGKDFGLKFEFFPSGTAVLANK